jgi:hypothetical protein
MAQRPYRLLGLPETRSLIFLIKNSPDQVEGYLDYLQPPVSGQPDVNLYDLSIKVELCAVTLLQSCFIALVSLGELPTLAQFVMQVVAGHLVDSCEVIECLCGVWHLDMASRGRTWSFTV